MLRARDSAFIVDHRRQLSVPAPAVAGAKKDELSKKKKAGQHLQRAQQKAQQDAPAKAPGGKKAKAAPAIGTTGDAPAPKKSAKQKASKKEKAAKAAAAATAAAAGAAAKDAKVATAGGKKAAVAKAAVTTIAAATSAQTKVRMVGEMEQDGLKSRNLKMFLAPSRSANASHLPSWGTRHTSAFSSSSVADRLHDEILESTNYTRATVEQMRVHIEEMIANVRECVHSLWPQSKVETFGSYSTGIWLPSSDVDLVVLDVLEVIDSKKTVKHLRELAKVLGSQSWVESIVVLETAKIPVLKLVSAESSVPIDITFESAATHSGLLARDLIKRYAEEIPELYPLAIVFKQLLRERGLNDAYTGGLSSYSVVLMLIHFSQLRRNGQQCFEAAAVYASGSIPPLPSTLTPLDKLAKNLGDSAHSSTTTKIETQYSKSEVELAKESELVKKTSPAESPSVSYAAALGRSSSSKDQVASENENQIATSSKACAPATTPRFSYAAVAAGAVRVTPPAPPPSYAAALTAKPGTYDTSVSLSHKKAGAPFTSSARPLIAASESGAKSLKRDTATSDTISISSSYADTEESTSSVASNASSTADSDDEISKGLEQIPECSDVNEATDVSLGAHTLMILEFFGILFDYRKNGLSIRDGGYIYRLAENRRTEIGKPSLVIEDPIHPDRNVSASSFAFSKVVAVFEDSFYALKYYRPSKFAPTALSCLLSCSGHTVSVATKKTV